MTQARNRFISIILIVLLIFSSTATAFADDGEAADKEDQKKQEEQLKAKQEAEKKAAEEKAKKEAEAKAAAEKAKQEAEKKAAEEKAKQEAEAKAAAEKAKQEAEAKAAEEKQEKSEEPDKEAPQAEQPSTGGDTEKAAPDNEKPAKASDDSKKDSALKLNSELSDGTYKPEATFTGGSGRVTFSCDQVIIKNGEATAVFKVNTDNVTHLYKGIAPQAAEDKNLYDPKTGAIGKDVYPFSSRQVSFPVEINKTVEYSGRTNAMSVNTRWITSYTYTLTINDESQKISDDTTIPENGPSKPEETDDDSEDDGKDEGKDKSKLKDGTYKVKATTDRVMFYLYPKKNNPATTILVKKNGKMTATITLTGSGYDYVYMGTPKQAKKAGKKKWIKYKKVNGYYTFKIPVSALDKKLPITPHSHKYANDGDPSTDPWRPNKWIKFYSKGAKKVKDGTTIKTKGKANDRNDGNNGKQVKWADDGKKGTSAVNNKTSLKDGTYKPDKFSWSGGSGRLKYIRCTKITVRGGKAYATIEFGSSKYDSLRASGHTYSRSGGGNSKFTIPVKLNANNTIVGRTTAMSQPHWVRYNIYIYKKGAGAGKSGSGEGDDGHMTSTKKLSSKAPDLMGLEFKEEVEVKYAEYFKIFKYEQGITLIEIDQSSDTALYKDEKKKDKDKSKENSEGGGEDLGHVEYDDEGNIIAQSQNEIVDGLYQNNIVNYIVVPEGVEIPAGLDKDGIILQQPIEKSFLASEKAADVLEQLGLLDKVTTIGFDAEKDGSDELKKALEDKSMVLAGTAEKPDYAALVKAEADMGIFPSMVLPEKLDKEPTEDEKAEVEEKTENIGVLRKRFAALGTPMMIDRSDDEKTNYASAEWIKVYGAVFGKDKEAGIIFDKYVADNKKENNEQ